MFFSPIFPDDALAHKQSVNQGLHGIFDEYGKTITEVEALRVERGNLQTALQISRQKITQSNVTIRRFTNRNQELQNARRKITHSNTTIERLRTRIFDIANRNQELYHAIENQNLLMATCTHGCNGAPNTIFTIVIRNRCG